MIETFIIFFFVFGVPGLLLMTMLRYRHQSRMKELEMRGGSHTLHQLQASKADVEARLQNLETIVCSVDYELNAKLNRLASQQLLLQHAATRQFAGGAPDLAGDQAGVPSAQAFALGIEPGGRLANRYLIKRRLGAGGMGAVYLAQDEQLDEQVALKVVAGAALLDPGSKERFRREASAARRINHPNVVRIHDLGDSDGVLFLSMEYVAGTSLAEMLTRHGSLPPAQLRSVVAQLCAGLDAVHQAGVVHRDVKPANVLIDGNQRAKLIDFGLATLPQVEGMTVTGMILGTPEYMAPEQIRGKTIDPRTDIYALGALMYHALVGRVPFRADSPIAVGFAHCTEMPQSPHLVNPQVSEQWSQLVMRALAKDPTQRFVSATELAAALPPG